MPVPQWFARLARALAGRRLIAPTDRTLRATTSAPPPARDAAAFTLAKDTEWTDSRKAPLDPRLRVAFALLRHPDPKLVLDYTGIRLPAAQRSDAARAAALAVPVHVDLARPLDKEVSDELARANITLPGAYLDEAARNAGLRHVTGLLHTPLPTGIAVKEMSERLRAAVDLGVIERIALPAPALPCGALHEGETFAAIGMPPERKVVVDGEAIVADGTGVIVGIIDDGVCLAHANFIDDSLRSRILSIWDQGRQPRGPHWQALPDFPYGSELVNAASAAGPAPIDAALASHVLADGRIDEDAVYGDLDYFPYSTVEGRAFDPSTHGTHVLDAAAGNGRALGGAQGVASNADIVFVQLPPELVAAGGAVLTRLIADGALYVFARAEARAKALGQPVPAVVNVSFGNYTGPHDGTSPTEQALDALLAVPDRAIVIAAGNGFAAQCHATGLVGKAAPATLHWDLPAYDQSFNTMEIWYSRDSDLALVLTPPGGAPLPAVAAGGARYDVKDPDGNTIGYVDHIANANGHDHLIAITLNPTCTVATPGMPSRPGDPTSPPAPAGRWTVRLEKTASPRATRATRFHAWIERDEAHHRTVSRRMQSRFADGEADVRCTIAGLATGRRTIAVGAFNAATGEMAEYSACGPTRASLASRVRRTKPEVCAPAAADARGRGVRSASTRFAEPTRMAGTSIAAPQVAGLAALLLQVNRDLGNPPLAVDDLRAQLITGAHTGELRPNRHQAQDVHQPQKQADAPVWPHLVGAGRIDATESLTDF
ncbi:MAG: S8 family serine peptidase [Burkholderiales bacterium]